MVDEDLLILRSSDLLIHESYCKYHACYSSLRCSGKDVGIHANALDTFKD